jgi:hypothetical protein
MLQLEGRAADCDLAISFSQYVVPTMPFTTVVLEQFSIDLTGENAATPLSSSSQLVDQPVAPRVTSVNKPLANGFRSLWTASKALARSAAESTLTVYIDRCIYVEYFD